MLLSRAIPSYGYETTHEYLNVFIHFMLIIFEYDDEISYFLRIMNGTECVSVSYVSMYRWMEEVNPLPPSILKQPSFRPFIMESKHFSCSHGSIIKLINVCKLHKLNVNLIDTAIYSQANSHKCIYTHNKKHFHISCCYNYL